MSEEAFDTQVDNVEQVQTEQRADTQINFKEMIAADLREDPSLESIKDINGLAKSYISSQRMLGSSLRIPGEDASVEAKQDFITKLQQVPGVVKLPDGNNEEEMNQFFSKVGRPEAPDKYNIKVSEQLQPIEEQVDGFKKAAFEAGLTNDQAARLMQYYEKSLVEPQLQNFEVAREQGEQYLKQKWGTDYQARVNGAKSVAAHYAQRHPEAMQALVNGEAGNNPALIEILSDLASGLSEQGVIQGQGKANYGMTAEEALEKIQEIRGNRAHAFYNETDPEHQAAVAKVQKLYGVAYSD